ncbi:MAG: nuclear transport factor 2 family protein [Pseudomonadota bacterium]
MTEEAKIHARTLEWVGSWATSPEQPFDLDRVKHIYAQDETFSSFDFGRPHAGFQSWAPAEAYYRKFMTVPKVWQLTSNDDLRVSIRGDVAWSTLSLKGSGEMQDGTPIAMPEARVTLILEKRGAEWLIVHEHGSSALPIPDEATTRRFLAS